MRHRPRPSCVDRRRAMRWTRDMLRHVDDDARQICFTDAGATHTHAGSTWRITFPRRRSVPLGAAATRCCRRVTLSPSASRPAGRWVDDGFAAAFHALIVEAAGFEPVPQMPGSPHRGHRRFFGGSPRRHHFGGDFADFHDDRQKIAVRRAAKPCRHFAPRSAPQRRQAASAARRRGLSTKEPPFTHCASLLRRLVIWSSPSR